MIFTLKCKVSISFVTQSNKPGSAPLNCSKAEHWHQDIVKASGLLLQGTKQGEGVSNA